MSVSPAVGEYWIQNSCGGDVVRIVRLSPRRTHATVEVLRDRSIRVRRVGQLMRQALPSEIESGAVAPPKRSPIYDMGARENVHRWTGVGANGTDPVQLERPWNATDFEDIVNDDNDWLYGGAERSGR